MLVGSFLKNSSFVFQMLFLICALSFFLPMVLEFEVISQDEKTVDTGILSMETIKKEKLYKIVISDGKILYLSHSFLKIDDEKLQMVKDSNLQIGYYRDRIVTSISLVGNEEIVVSKKNKQIDEFFKFLFALFVVMLLVTFGFFVIKRMLNSKKMG